MSEKQAKPRAVKKEVQKEVKKEVKKDIHKTKPSAPREQNGDIFALDIGTRTVVGMIGRQEDERFLLEDYVVIPHTKQSMKDGQIEDIRQVAKIVGMVKAELETRCNIRLSQVSIAAAGRALKTKQIVMKHDISNYDSVSADLVKSIEIETIQAAQAELDEEYKAEAVLFYCVGHSVIRYKLDDYEIISLEGHKGQEATIELIATFLPNVVVEGLYSVMELNGLEVQSMTLEPIAAMNVIIPREIRLINIALVDIGAGTSDIAISRDGSIVAYAMATVAGDEITEVIIREYFVEFAVAEEMKHKSTSGAKQIDYRDIFGIVQTVRTADFVKKIDASVSMLAGEICRHIVGVNGGPPAAVFLVGGGSLAPGLSAKVAEGLELDPARVAIGSEKILRSVDTGGRPMGAEFVTPLGIGVTCIMNRGYDFSQITLNDKRIRIFDTKQLSIFDLLTMEGYKSHEILGRAGRSLTFSVNGKHQTIKGGLQTPAEITVNGKPASLNTSVTQGDSISFTPAVSGENARARLSDVCEAPVHGSVHFGGEKHVIGIDYYSLGNKLEMDYEIQPFDVIERRGVVTLDDLLISLDVEFSGITFTVNGEPANGAYVLIDGDIVDYESAYMKPDEWTKPAVRLEPAPPEDEYPESAWGEITVTLNGDTLILPRKTEKTPHLFLELLNHTDMDPQKSTASQYVMTRNGEEASFNTELATGDVCVIKWEE